MQGQTGNVSAADDWLRLFNDGIGHFNTGRLDAAADSFRRVTTLRPALPQGWGNLGAALRQLNRSDEAIAVLAEGLRHHPDHPEILTNLGVLLNERQRHQEALPVFQRLVAARFDFPGALLSLGNTFIALDEARAAEMSYRLAMLLEPGSATVFNNLGAAILSQCRPDDAAPFYRRAIQLAPHVPEHHKNLGTCQLIAGKFEEGTREYEWRHEQSVWRWKRTFPGKTPWQGEPLAGKTLLVTFEQGLGDSFQFIRYMPVLQSMGARVIFECQKQLTRVLSTAPGVDALIPHGQPLPDFDYHVPLMSLMQRLGTTPDTVPGGVPYLRAEPERVAAWRSRMDLREFRIGINWRANELARSIPLELFEPLARIPGVRLYSLQQVVGKEQLAALRDRLGIVDWSEEMDVGPDGFIDTAAVMANMDLLVTCDSAVNHLAGAMGLPVWLALRWFSDWRWMRIPDRSPWYPTMRLFRSDRKNDWTGVMERVAAEAARLVASRRNDSPDRSVP